QQPLINQVKAHPPAPPFSPPAWTCRCLDLYSSGLPVRLGARRPHPAPDDVPKTPVLLAHRVQVEPCETVAKSQGRPAGQRVPARHDERRARVAPAGLEAEKPVLVRLRPAPGCG